MTLDDLEQVSMTLNNKVQCGCGNHGCVIKKPVGVATNGGCTCTPRHIAWYLKRIVQQLEAMSSVTWDK